MILRDAKLIVSPFKNILISLLLYFGENWRNSPGDWRKIPR